MTHHRTIAGQPYTLTQITSLEGSGWRVTAASTLADRFHRSYFTRPTTSGWRCTCPDHHHRGRACKHIQAVLALEDELYLTSWPSWACIPLTGDCDEEKETEQAFPNHL